MRLCADAICCVALRDASHQHAAATGAPRGQTHDFPAPSESHGTLMVSPLGAAGATNTPHADSRASKARVADSSARLRTPPPHPKAARNAPNRVRTPNA